MTRINHTDISNKDEAAKDAVNTVNAAIGEVQTEAAAIDSEAAAIVADAEGADPTDAAKLAKRVEALRVRRVANILRELKILPLKESASTAVRIAAKQQGEQWSRELVEIEAVIGKAADMIGAVEGTVRRTSMIRTDPNRNSLVGAIRDCGFAACNYSAVTADDKARVVELKGQLASMLR